MADLLSEIRIETNRILQEHKFYKSYRAKEIATNYIFRADIINKILENEEDKNAFRECCSKLKNSMYIPSKLPFHGGAITPEGKGILFWRYPDELKTLREIINSDEYENIKRHDWLMILGLLSHALEDLSKSGINGHLDLTIDNVLTHPLYKCPVMVRYGLHDFWIKLYGESGKIASLICPPEKMNDKQSNIEDFFVYDCYAFGILMYQILTKQTLDETRPFDRNLLNNNLTNVDDLFLREMILSSTSENSEDRIKYPNNFKSIFVTLLSQKMKYVLFYSYCRFCAAKGDQKAEQFLHVITNKKEKETPPIQGIPVRHFQCKSPTAVSFIIGKKVVHNVDAFIAKINEINNYEQEESSNSLKRIIFIAMFGSYQQGKSTTLNLLSGNTHYVIGNGKNETTRGVSIDGPYTLSHFIDAFGNIPNQPFLDSNIPMEWNDDIKNENPYVFLIDIEGFDGDIIGFDDRLNKKLYKDLVRPYLALSTNVLFMCNQNQGRFVRDYAVDNLSIENFVNSDTANFLNLMMIIKQVESYEDAYGDSDYDNPFDKNQFEKSSLEFRRKFGTDFNKKGISITVCPLGKFDTHFQRMAQGNDIPIFDKSFIVMARKLLNEIFSLSSSTHITNKNGSIELFKSVSAVSDGRSFSEEENNRIVQAGMLRSHLTLIEDRFVNAKNVVIGFMTRQILTDIQNLQTLNIPQLDLMTHQWLEKLKDKFRSEIDSDPLMMSYDVVGYRERVIEQAKNEFHDIIYQILTPRLANDIKSKIEMDVNLSINHKLNEIFSNLMGSDGWNYFVEYYQNKDQLVDKTFGSEFHKIMNDPSLANWTNDEFQNWMIDLKRTKEQQFRNRVDELFDKANIFLAKRNDPIKKTFIEKNPIKGNKEYEKVKYLITWKAPNGEKIEMFQEFDQPKENHICILI